ncbi:SCO family protein [Nitrosomonas sp.]|uniref:SCO family protein n=1 Tax=Nitrosomonas sp. TaxID=42353 RepID=UPI0025F2EF68|nr:SCO family protein [Nitrosomonas sp.]
MGLAALGLVGLNSVWQKLSFDDNTSTRNSNISKYKPAGDATPFPNVTLYTHDGEAVKFYDDLIRDKVVAINMMYSQCSGICPKSTANLREVRNILGERAGRDVFMYSITLDPERDTPRLLKQYAERNRWSMAPTLADPMQIMATINHLDSRRCIPVCTLSRIRVAVSIS